MLLESNNTIHLRNICIFYTKVLRNRYSTAVSFTNGKKSIWTLAWVLDHITRVCWPTCLNWERCIRSEKHKTYGKVSFSSKNPEIRQLEQFLIGSGRQALFWISWASFSEDLNISGTKEELVYIESDHIIRHLQLVLHASNASVD